MLYTYGIDFFRDDGTLISQSPIEPDWLPALEWAHFEGIREGRLPPALAANLAAGAFGVEPVWHATAGQPYVGAFRITLPANGRGVVERQIPTAYLDGVVQRASSALVANGLVQKGETFRFLISAGAPAAPAPRPPDIDFAVEQIAQPLPLVRTPLDSRRRGARPTGEQIAGDFPLFVPQTVLDESIELSRQAGDLETGGVLIGFLHHDRDVPEIFVEITAQIHALHTAASSTKLTFTPDTWAAARAALALRKRGEALVGWWHAHQNFCRLRQCPPEDQLRCSAARPFFSTEDVALHSALFARAYHTALLISDSAGMGRTASVFGWRQGMVVGRGFHTTFGEDRHHDAHPTD